MKPRAKTDEECRKEFLNQVRSIARYWASLPDKNPAERCDGTAFSILVLLDGGSGELPAYDVTVSPHPLDKKYHQDQGMDWYEEGTLINNCQLHEYFHKSDK